MNEASERMAPLFSGGERWSLHGRLTIDSAARALAASARAPLPSSGLVSLDDVRGVDSAAVAVLLAWKRRALGERRPLTFAAVPPSLAALAQLYGVEQLLAPETDAAPAA